MVEVSYWENEVFVNTEDSSLEDMFFDLNLAFNNAQNENPNIKGLSAMSLSLAITTLGKKAFMGPEIMVVVRHKADGSAIVTKIIEQDEVELSEEDDFDIIEWHKEISSMLKYFLKSDGEQMCLAKFKSTKTWMIDEHDVKRLKKAKVNIILN